MLDEKKDLNKKMLELQTAVMKVRMLRAQFPTDPHLPDHLAIAITTLQDEQQIFPDMEITIPVRSAQSEYNEAQSNVKHCSDNSKLNGFIEIRNEARQDFFEAINTFCASVDDLPLDQRCNKLKSCISGLEATYPTFLTARTSAGDLSEVVAIFKMWQGKLKFDEVRAATDTSQYALNLTQQLLIKKCSLNLNESSEDLPMIENFNLLLDQFQNDLNSEISETDIEKTEQANLVSLLLTTLLQELRKELVDIDKLLEMVTTYTQLRKDIEPWLEKSPDVSEILTIISSIKQLKSQLRHRLADKQDLEESDQCDGEDMDKVTADLALIRTHLHTAFNHQHQLLAELANLADNHFPELFLTRPELNLENEVQHKGLVKLGRSLDQYCITVLPGVEKKGLHRAVYLNTPVVLKEYFIEESLGIRKSDFLDRALQYNAVKCPYLVPVDYIFFVQERSGYVQVPYYSICLASIESSLILQWPEKVKYAIIKNVSEALAALHDHNIVHGSVNPTNVFINQQNQAMLAEFNFSKTVEQRLSFHHPKSCATAFTANQQDCSLYKSHDMYCLGLLILYLIDPNLSNPASAFHLPQIPPMLQGIVENLLQGDVSEQYSARELLDESLFNQDYVIHQSLLSHSLEVDEKEEAESVKKLQQVEAGTGQDSLESEAELDFLKAGAEQALSEAGADEAGEEQALSEAGADEALSEAREEQALPEARAEQNSPKGVRLDTLQGDGRVETADNEIPAELKEKLLENASSRENVVNMSAVESFVRALGEQEKPNDPSALPRYTMKDLLKLLPKP